MTGRHSKPDTMLVFDLDGVVTDLKTHEPNHEVLDIISRDLKQGLPVAFITGRALQWVKEKVLTDLESSCSEAEMANLLIVTEKGAITIVREGGKLRIETDKRLALPDAFRDEARELLHKSRDNGPFSDKMFWDESKQIIVSIEKLPGTSQTDFTDARTVLVKELKELLAKHRLTDFKVDATTIATDVEHVSAGKHKGGQDVLDWLRLHGSEPRSFTVFGDSASDSAIAETLGAQGAKTVFVFVGDPLKLKPTGKELYTSVITGGGYSNDAAKYLRELNS